MASDQRCGKMRNLRSNYNVSSGETSKGKKCVKKKECGRDITPSTDHDGGGVQRNAKSGGVGKKRKRQKEVFGHKPTFTSPVESNSHLIDPNELEPLNAILLNDDFESSFFDNFSVTPDELNWHSVDQEELVPLKSCYSIFSPFSDYVDTNKLEYFCVPPLNVDYKSPSYGGSNSNQQKNISSSNGTIGSVRIRETAVANNMGTGNEEMNKSFHQVTVTAGTNAGHDSETSISVGVKGKEKVGEKRNWPDVLRVRKKK